METGRANIKQQVNAQVSVQKGGKLEVIQTSLMSTFDAQIP
jgi:hypothetical protein